MSMINSTAKQAYLVAGENQGIGDHNVLTTTSRKDDNLGNVITSQRFDAPVDG
jgi:hypothetical protein